MTRIASVAVALFAISCGPRQQPIDPGHDRPLSVAEHEAEADRHERIAAEEKAQVGQELQGAHAQPMQCYDNPLVPDPSSGGETIHVLKPCWTSVTQRTGDHERRAEVNRQAAREHRAHAAALIRTEKESCAGLGEDEVSHSPFYHSEDIASVQPYRVGATLRGARVVFRKVPGLDADWLRRSIACHQARAAVMGYSNTFMRYCPLAVGPMDVAVSELKDGFEVILRSKDGVVAAAALGRAEDLHGGE